MISYFIAPEEESSSRPAEPGGPEGSVVQNQPKPGTEAKADPEQQLPSSASSNLFGEMMEDMPDESMIKMTKDPAPMTDIVNDMSTDFTSPKTSNRGYFPDHFEDGFDQLPWRAHLWKIKPTVPFAPFFDESTTQYSAEVNMKDIMRATNPERGHERATLELEVNSVHGGRICFYLYADLGKYV